MCVCVYVHVCVYVCMYTCLCMTHSRREEEFLQNNQPATWWTGKNDIRKIQTWYKYQGSTQLEHGYNFTMTYGGYGAGQVPPFFQDYPHEVLEFFTTTYLRTIQVIYQSETNEWFDIPMWRYVCDPMDL
jgi:CD36 family